METNEIMNNTEVMETAEEVVKTTPNRNGQILGGVILAGVAFTLAYNYLIKPALENRAKKEADKEATKTLHATVEGEAEEVDSSEN